MIGAFVRVVSLNPLLSLALAAAIVVFGVRSYQELPIDAVPDVSNVQAQVIAAAPGLSPLEVESQVMQSLERSLSGLPHIQRLRSVSRAGIGVVTLVFEPGTDIMSARETISQKLPGAREQIGDRVESLGLGPLTTGLGEVFHFTTEWPGHSLAELRTLIDWEIAPRLGRVPGVVEVNSWGGDRRQIVVRPDMGLLAENGLGMADIADALTKAGRSESAGMIEGGAEGAFIRVDSSYRTLEDIRHQVVRHVGDREYRRVITLGEVATVSEGKGPRLSAATAEGTGETIYTMVQMLSGENAHKVVADVKRRIAELKTSLPSDVRIEPFYDRSAFVEDVLSTVRRNLLEGGIIVTLVLLLMLGSLRAGLLVASVIPLSMLGAFSFMQLFGISGNLLSLGAIDFGLVVDGAVVVVEGALATMALHRTNARSAVARVGAEVGRPVTLAVLIIAVVYVPILLLEGVEGRLFRPMALTVLFALATAFVLSFTWVPTLAAWLLPSEAKAEPTLARLAREQYLRWLRPLLNRPYWVGSAVLLVLGAGLWVASTLGGEFVPRLEEGGFAIQVTRPASVSLSEAIAGTTRVEQALGGFAEVERVVSRIGSPDVATDVMGVEQADVLVKMKRREEWKTASDAAGFADVLLPALQEALPGAGFAFTQPIEMRVSELIGGVQSALGVKVFGDDLPALRKVAEQIASQLSQIDGAADVRVEPTAGLETWTLKPRPEQLAKVGVESRSFVLYAQALSQGVRVGELKEGLRRFPVVLRQGNSRVQSISELQRAPVLTRGMSVVPMSDVAHVERQEGPAQVSREQGRRRILVEANVRGRDLAGFVQEVQRKLAAIRLPVGSYLEYGGQYENLARAVERLKLVVPLTLAAVLLLLYLALGSLRPALLVFVNVPAAAIGGVFALALRQLEFSMSAAVGFLALFGVATLNGVVLLSAMLLRERQGEDAFASVYSSAGERLRPVLTTALVAALGFLPMALATGTGAEVQQPLATVVIGGLLTSTLATLFVLPTLHLRLRRT